MQADEKNDKVQRLTKSSGWPLCEACGLVEYLELVRAGWVIGAAMPEGS